jgi:hypothetical protein
MYGGSPLLVCRLRNLVIEKKQCQKQRQIVCKFYSKLFVNYYVKVQDET